MTPLEVYESKTAACDREETPEMRRGTLLEPVVRQMYADQTGRQVVVPENMIQSRVGTPSSLANLDGIIVPEQDRLLECKTARDKGDWGEPGTPRSRLNISASASTT